MKELVNRLSKLKSPLNIKYGQAYLEYLNKSIPQCESLDEVFNLTNDYNYSFIEGIDLDLEFDLYEYIIENNIPYIARYKNNIKKYQIILFKNIDDQFIGVSMPHDRYTEIIVNQERTSFILRSVSKLSVQSLNHIVDLFNVENNGMFFYSIILKIFELLKEDKSIHFVDIVNRFNEDSIRKLYDSFLKDWDIQEILLYKDLIPLDILSKEHKKEYLLLNL